MDGFSGAEIENIVNLSALEAVRSNEKEPKIQSAKFLEKVQESVREKKGQSIY